MVKAFQSLGVEVSEIPLAKGGDELRSFESHARRDFQAVFTIDSGGGHNFISFLRDLRLSSRIPWIIWFVDDPEGYGFPEAYDPNWTLVFCWDREIIQGISKESSWKGPPLIHLPLATDPEIFFPDKDDFNPLIRGGVFVGSTAHPNKFLDEAIQRAKGFLEEVERLWEVFERHITLSPQEVAWRHLQEKTGYKQNFLRENPLCRLWVQAAIRKLGLRKRLELVSLLIGPDGAVYGDSPWAEIVGDQYRGRIQYGNELRRIYNSSGFVLDVRQPHARTGLTQRIFDASACGRPVLVESSPEVEFFFEPGEDVLSFKSKEEGMEMKEYLLGDPQTAQRRAFRAKSKVLLHHTYRNRANQILEAFQPFFASSLA